ncbi:MAG: hypothetical protein FJ265_04360 [Planctomycetes bacterium]|nr:hypothetical protein [Planctomycetota bacterium]
MNVGLAIPGARAAFDGDVGVPAYVQEDQDYVRQIVRRYGLSSAQERSLRLVVQAAREEELQALSSAEAAQLPAALQNKLLAARSRAEQRLRVLLTEAQCARYDADSRPRQDR